MYFQLGRVQTYTDFHVWRNNYGILATNINQVMAPHSGAVTAGDNRLNLSLCNHCYVLGFYPSRAIPENKIFTFTLFPQCSFSEKLTNGVLPAKTVTLLRASTVASYFVHRFLIHYIRYKAFYNAFYSSDCLGDQLSTRKLSAGNWSVMLGDKG